MRTLIVRYDEIGIKKRGTRNKMENILISNLLAAAKFYGCGKVEVKKHQGRIFLYGNVDCLSKSSVKVFGVRSVSIAEELSFNNLSDIAKNAKEIWHDKVTGKKFAVNVRRVGEHNFSSYDVAKLVGEALLKNDNKVDLDNPEITLYIEIRDNKVYFYDNVIEGFGGLPLGSEGTAISLISGGIDSPVSSWMIMKRGVALDFLYCNLGSEITKSAVLNVIYKLMEWSHGYTPKIFVADCSLLTKTIMTQIDKKIWPLAFKRALYKIAEGISKKIGYEAIITGESLGQVSTQTLSAIKVLNYGITLPILRPLIGFDKDEITKMARKIGTYEYSEKVPEYCSIFSFHPKTKISYSEILEIDKKLDNEIQNIINSIEKVDPNTDKSLNINELIINSIPEDSIIINLTNNKTNCSNSIYLNPKNVMEFIFKTGVDKNYVFCTNKDKFNIDLVYSLRKIGIKAFIIN
jgi:thiamine biosynthesis protein ThiI